MSNLRIYCQDATYKGIQLDETHLITYAHHSSLDLGTADFSMGLAFYSNSTVGNKGTLKILIHKGPYSLATDTGYDLSYDATNEKLVLTINDGDGSAAVASTANASLADDTWHIVWVNVDRNVGTSFYLNGAVISTSSDTTTNSQSTMNASESLVVGGFTGQNAYLKGYVSGIHLCPGFLPSATWVRDWYYRMKYCFPRLPPYLGSTVWTFPNSLNATTYNAYETILTQTGTYSSGTATYSSYYPLTIDYTLVDNYALNFERGFVQLDTLLRSIDGTAKYYEGGTKQRLNLTFTSNTVEQRYFVEGIWALRGTLEIYLDASLQLECRGFLTSPPNIVEIIPGIWQYGLEIEEI